MLLREFIDCGVSELAALYPADEARNIVLMLCEGIMGVKSYTHIVEPSKEVPLCFLEGLKSSILRLKEGEPIQYVLGKAEFRGLELRVDRNVLIPRPETEELVDMALKYVGRGARVLDLCTGSGCIAWAVAKESEAGEIIGVDISEKALSVASAQYCDPRVRFIPEDILLGLPQMDSGTFDVIISNPPYIMEAEKAEMRKNVLDYEPGLALFVPDASPLVFYEAIADISGRLLKAGGRGFVEINENLGLQTADVFKAGIFTDVRVHRDIFGKNRFISYSKT